MRATLALNGLNEKKLHSPCFQHKTSANEFNVFKGKKSSCLFNRDYILRKQNRILYGLISLLQTGNKNMLAGACIFLFQANIISSRSTIETLEYMKYVPS